MKGKISGTLWMYMLDGQSEGLYYMVARDDKDEPTYSYDHTNPNYEGMWCVEEVYMSMTNEGWEYIEQVFGLGEFETGSEEY